MHEDPATAAPQGNVFLVEDDVAVRSSLALLLQLNGYAIAQFGSAEQFLELPPPLPRPACVIADVRLPGMSGIALQARMVHDHRAPPVLLMTAQGSETMARSALLQGAVDFLEKPIDEKALLTAVATGIRGDIERMTRSRERDAVTARLALLSRNEALIFEHVTNGRPVREIAEEMGLAVDVLEQQRGRMMEKLGVVRVTDLFRLRFHLGEVLSDRPGRR